MTIGQAIAECRLTGLSGWALVEYAQKLVAHRMAYSYFHSFDMPDKAFERGEGYCWQQAGALNRILLGLGLNSSLVHAYRNRFIDVVREGVLVHIGTSGHVWCRVTIDGCGKDVCPGADGNIPGVIHFEPLTKVRRFRGPIVLFGYLGSAYINHKRGKRFLQQKARLQAQ